MAKRQPSLNLLYSLISQSAFLKKPWCKQAWHVTHILSAANFGPIPVCPENETYDGCGTYCQPDCTNYFTATPCKWDVCVKGCFCRFPLIRGPDGKCIRRIECPRIPRLLKMNEDEETDVSVIPDCEENEDFRYCGTMCPRNCTNYDQDIPCPLVCDPGCYCQHPLVRGPDGKCIDVKECPPRSGEDTRNEYPGVSQIAKCEKNLEFSFCTSICPDTCNNYKEERFCELICFPGCGCRPGYVLSRSGECIKKEHCVEDRPEDCSQLETYNECGSYCETNCFNYKVKSRDCNVEGCRKGCYCKQGLVRSPDMKCILPFECPHISIKTMLEESDHSKEANYFRSRM